MSTTHDIQAQRYIVPYVEPAQRLAEEQRARDRFRLFTLKQHLVDVQAEIQVLEQKLESEG